MDPMNYKLKMKCRDAMINLLEITCITPIYFSEQTIPQWYYPYSLFRSNNLTLPCLINC